MEKEIFCYSSDYQDICKKALEHDYFKKRNLTFQSAGSESGDDCPMINFQLVEEAEKRDNFKMEVKMCYATKQNGAETESVKVYLQSAYTELKETVSKFFVLFAYKRLPSTRNWKMTTNQLVDRNFRYEAILHF